VGDASEQIPVPKGEVDVVFLGVVLHDMVEAGIDAVVLAEITRVLKIDGILALLEWKKDAPLEPGPPREIRLEPKQLKAILLPYGFKLQKLKDWNDYHYLITFIYEGKSKIE
jgi:ubiquinone/menaquinone biosynthesis C-methylase UbiE